MWSHLLRAACTCDSENRRVENESKDKIVDLFTLCMRQNAAEADCPCKCKGEARGRKEADSYGDLIPLDISWLGECGGTPCFIELAWII